MYPSIVKCIKTAVNCSVASVADWRAGQAWPELLATGSADFFRVNRNNSRSRDLKTFLVTIIIVMALMLAATRAEFQTFFEAVHCIAIATIIMKK